MKILNFIIVLFTLYSCESKSQEKITKLPSEDQKIISKILNDKTLQVMSISKIDSSQNIKNELYYDANLSLYRKKISTFNREKKLVTLTEYDNDSKNKEFLSLFKEQKYTYSEKSAKMKSQVWRNNKKDGNSIYEKTYDEQGRIIEDITESKYEDENTSTTIKKSYKYNIDFSKNIVTVCEEEYSSTSIPKFFEICETYHYKNGQITNNKVGNSYQYDDKNRLIKEIRFNKDKSPHFEDLYIYDDAKNTMEHQRYRFDHSRFLAVKDVTYYNKIGLIERKVKFEMNTENRLSPKEEIFIFYDTNNKEMLKVETKTKTFLKNRTNFP